MGESLTNSHFSFETPCGAYGHFKITRYLLRVTCDSRYGESMERVLYNTILRAKPFKEDGTNFYYSDYNTRFAKKGYYKDKWPCCSGTSPQLTADYGISSYSEPMVTWRPGQLPIGQTAKARSGYRVQSLCSRRDRQYEVHPIALYVLRNGQNRPSLESNVRAIRLLAACAVRLRAQSACDLLPKECQQIHIQLIFVDRA